MELLYPINIYQDADNNSYLIYKINKSHLILPIPISKIDLLLFRDILTNTKDKNIGIVQTFLSVLQLAQCSPSSVIISEVKNGLLMATLTVTTLSGTAQITVRAIDALLIAHCANQYVYLDKNLINTIYSITRLNQSREKNTYPYKEICEGLGLAAQDDFLTLVQNKQQQNQGNHRSCAASSVPVFTTFRYTTLSTQEVPTLDTEQAQQLLENLATVSRKKM